MTERLIEAGLAAVATGIAVALSFPARWRVPQPQGAAVRPLRRPAVAVPGLVLGALLALPTWLQGRRLVLAVIVLLGVLAVGHLLRRARHARVAQRRAEQVLAVCEALAADLRAGEPPVRALDRAAAEWPELAAVARAAHLGADVPAALRTIAARPGAEQLRAVAAAWQVAHRSGASLAPAVSRAAQAIAEARTVRRLVAAQLASAHATARLVAALPFVMLLLGSGLGGDPVGFLIGTTGGLACLGVGLALSFLGLVWLDRIAAGVLR